ncbi:MAG: DUF1264 domain-containing protein [Gemmataceae bacterium]
MDRRELFGAVGAIGAGMTCGAASAAPHSDKAGASPMTGPHLHFCGIHMAKKNPKLQFITQHYCAAHTGGPDGDIFQCVLFDGTGQNAKLIGVEYLISDAAYRKLPETEKPYWHAHTYEVLGGGLIAPGMQPKDESAFMKVVHMGQGVAHLARPQRNRAYGRTAAHLVAHGGWASRPESGGRARQAIQGGHRQNSRRPGQRFRSGAAERVAAEGREFDRSSVD